MNEIMYDQNSVLITCVLFVCMVAAAEVGYRIALRFSGSSSESSRAHVGAIQASLLGVLALMLGFTFSLSLQRFDSRSEAVVDEANAIGTAYLRADLLPEAQSAAVRQQIADYLDLRVQAGSITLADGAEREAVLARSQQQLERLWDLAVQAASQDAGPVTTGLFIQALNELIDSFGRRDAALNRHVPEVVLFVLFGTFLMTGTIVGYASGHAGHRVSLVAYIMIALIVLLVFIIIDLDRPRRGLIEVDQRAMVQLLEQVRADRLEAGR